LTYPIVITDGVFPPTGAKATVQAFHSADNQQPGNAAFGLLTGGVAQLLNSAGNLDRQRETGTDGIPAQGIATGAAQFAMAFLTACTGNLAAGTQTYTPAAMSGTVGGVSWSIQVGTVLVVDSGAAKETVVVTAVTSTTFTAFFANAHNGSVTAFPIKGYVYNQERDASGELDGASGSGTAIAAEYEFNGGGPASGGGNNFDRARNIQGKGKFQTTVASGLTSSGVTTFTVASGGTGVNQIQPGQPIYITSLTTGALGGTHEVAYTALNQVAGSSTILLQSATVNTYSAGAFVFWDVYSDVGPTTSTLLPTGIGIEEDVVFDPTTNLFGLVRAPTADAMAGANLEGVGPSLFNGATFDRQRNNNDTGAIVTLSAATTQTTTTSNQTNFNGRGLNLVINITAISGTSPTLTVTLQGVDTASSAVYTILVSAALTATGTTVLSVYPGLTAAANTVANAILPRTFNIKYVIGGTSPSVTATIGASVIV
jgi:hypothetical protein